MLSFSQGPWWIEPIDDAEKFNLPKGTIYQIMCSINGQSATVCTIEDYQEVSEKQDRAADASLIAMAPAMLECLIALAEDGTDSPMHQRAVEVIARARTPYGKYPK